MIFNEVLYCMNEFQGNFRFGTKFEFGFFCLLFMKFKRVSKVGDFRLISMVVSIYKLLAKVLAFGLKEVLSQLIRLA